MKTPSLGLLERHHRRQLWEGTLWVGVAGLALDAALVPIGVESRCRIGIMAFAALLAGLVRLIRRQTLRATACALDARISSQNRFEAVTEVRHRTDPLAEALRAEAAHHLSGQSLPRPYGWILGVALLVALLAFRLAEPRPPRLAPAPAKTVSALALPARAEPARIESETAAPPPKAALRWLSPEAQIGATPEEIIPLSAEGESTTGLNQLALHVSVNGDPRPLVSLPDTLPAGTKAAAIALRLGSFQTRPYDLVTYYLTARPLPPRGAAAGPRWPEIASPLQFIQIRAALADFTLGAMATGNADAAEHLLDLVKSLEAAEQRVLEKSFALTHRRLAGDSSDWRSALRQLAAEQKGISRQVQEFASSAAAANLPPAARRELLRIRGEMDRAAAALARADPAAAEAEERSLAGLPAVEKSLEQIERKAQLQDDAGASPAAQPVTPPPAEPIQSATLARLAREQQALAQRFAQGEAGPGAFAAQDRLARELAQLADANGLPADISGQVKAAAAEAQAAARQLNEGDPVAAGEPAARAAMVLNQAVKGLAADRHSRAAATLAAVQRLLIGAAGAVRSTEKSAAGSGRALSLTLQAHQLLNSTANRLDDQANRQALAKEAALQREGNAGDSDEPPAEKFYQQEKQASPDPGDDARALRDVADAIDASKIEADLKKLVQAGDSADPKDKAAAAQKLLDLAQKIAGRLSMFGDPQKIQGQALENLRRDKANLQGAAGASPAAAQDFYDNAVADAQVAKSVLSRSRANPDSNSSEKQRSAPSPAPASDQSGGAQGGNKTPDDASTPPPAPGGALPGQGGSGSGGSGEGGGSGGGGAGGGRGRGDGMAGGSGTISPKSGGGQMPEGSGNGGDGGTQGGSSQSSVGSGSPGNPNTLKRPTGAASGNVAGPKQGDLQAVALPVAKAGGKRDVPADTKLGTSLQQGGPDSRSVQNTFSPSAKDPDIFKPTFGDGGATPPPGPLQSKIGAAAPSAEALSRQLAGLIAQLELSAASAPRTQTLTTANPADAPPAYRSAVADYFESLARDPAPPVPVQP